MLLLRQAAAQVHVFRLVPRRLQHRSINLRRGKTDQGTNSAKPPIQIATAAEKSRSKHTNAKSECHQQQPRHQLKPQIQVRTTRRSSLRTASEKRHTVSRCVSSDFRCCVAKNTEERSIRSELEQLVDGERSRVRRNDFALPPSESCAAHSRQKTSDLELTLTASRLASYRAAASAAAAEDEAPEGAEALTSALSSPYACSSDSSSDLHHNRQTA